MKKEFCSYVPAVLRRLLLAWLTAAAVCWWAVRQPLRSLEGLEAVQAMSLGWLLGIVAVVFVASWALRLSPKVERWLLTTVFGLLWVSVLLGEFSWAMAAAGALILCMLAGYALWGWEGEAEVRAPAKDRGRGWLILAAVAAVCFALFVSAWTVCRVLSFSSPTFDFGIFTQMFHHMRTTGLPNTTVERDGLLSHFDVHVSPSWYLLLPVYWLVPEPATLQVLQAVVLASLVIPLWLLGRRHGLPGWARALLCLLALLYPALAGGTGYDIHENALLTPLLLWLFYALDRECLWLTALAALLTLGVKEDAAVYVAVIALYQILRSLLTGRWKALTVGGILLAGSLSWFFCVTAYLAQYGDGVMTWRYQNFMIDGSDSLLSVVKAVLLCPMKLVYECVDREKWLFLLQTMLPLLGLPLLTRRYERLVLLIPYILVNLMPDYQYQHHIFFQYTFGSTACLLYLTAVNLADLLPKLRVKALPLLSAVLTAAVCFGVWVVPTGAGYVKRYITYRQYYQTVASVLDGIPEEASVTATTFYAPYLAQRAVLYDVRYSSRQHMLETEYVVLSVGESDSYKKYGGYERLVQLLEQEGYTMVDSLPGTLAVYKKECGS